jgi:hypothetical protein
MLFQNTNEGVHLQTLDSYLEKADSKIKRILEKFFILIIHREGRFVKSEWWVLHDRPYKFHIYAEVLSKNPTPIEDPMSTDLRHYNWQELELPVTPCRRVPRE